MRLIALLVVTALALSACGSKFEKYTGPEVTRIYVFKEKRRMYLMHEEKVLSAYDVDLGFDPIGHKEREGDGRTPEGAYLIDRRNPNSEFFLSIGISYPNRQDVAYAQSLGVSPGGDIFIHGRPEKYKDAGSDWTAGCIAVTNKEMREIYAMVENGTPIYIFK